MKKYLLAIAFITSSTTSFAEPLLDGKAYAGASVGMINTMGNERCSDTQHDCMNWKLYGGYKLNQHLALEAGYYKLMDSDIDMVDATGRVTDTYNTSRKGLAASAVGSMPLGSRSEVFAKVGIISTSKDIDYKNSLTADSTSSSADVLYGVGASMNLTSNWAIRGEYEGVKADSKFDDMGLLSAGLTFKSF